MKRSTYTLLTACVVAVAVPAASRAQGMIMIGSGGGGTMTVQTGGSTAGSGTINVQTSTEAQATDSNKAATPAVDTAALASVRAKIKEAATKHYLVILDGVVSTTKALKTLVPQDVKTIDVLDSATAVQQYGSKGKKGAVVITTSTKAETAVPSTKTE